jgi:predicted RND superfamily exporter protein
MLLVSRYQALAMRPKADEADADAAPYRAMYSQQSPLNDSGKYDGQITRELVLDGTRERFLPTVLTAIATALAFLPFLLFGNIPGHEIMQPMAIVVLGGLVTATLVNLYLLPALYLWLKPQPQEDVTAEAKSVGKRAEQPVGAV